MTAPVEAWHHAALQDASLQPTHGGVLNWDFKQGERTTALHLKGRLIFNRSAPMVEAARAGHGLAWVPDDIVRPCIADGSLVEVLEEFAISYPGYHVYYATRRASPALALVVEALSGAAPARQTALEGTLC